MCQINTEPMISEKGYLDVTVPPSIVEEDTSTDITVDERSKVSMRCKAAGYPKPRISIFRSNQPKSEFSTRMGWSPPPRHCDVDSRLPDWRPSPRSSDVSKNDSPMKKGYGIPAPNSLRDESQSLSSEEKQLSSSKDGNILDSDKPKRKQNQHPTQGSQTDSSGSCQISFSIHVQLAFLLAVLLFD
ncbi:hypothetical protein HNY73_022773 [Argiope bruennichi]|uniref:Uncharacterized protein n=1 Tax=Argiope bruennichi TaxID=94029 RepID=A0A8T0E2R0_ARGBR|nr:hypothetical protein HNY73_022773 [Argiope bruennichi]